MNAKFKQFLFLFVLIFAQSKVFCQVHNAPFQNKHEIGIDASEIVNRLFRSGNSPFENEYFVNYKYHMEKLSFRLRLSGALLAIDRERERIDSETEDLANRQSLALATGVERQLAFKGRWRANYGIEALYHVSNSTNKSSNSFGNTTKSRDRYHTVGTNLIVGLQYKISSWLSIASEASYTYRFQTQYSNRSSNVDNQSIERVQRHQTRFIPSSGIIISATF